ncbi:MAG: GGDEF domain-containing protein [Desulfobacterales bacterium]|nr:GGDEF domain-containing protein [Desulfobacterales bacterium]
MRNSHATIEELVQQLSDLSSFLSTVDPYTEDLFTAPLEIIHRSMRFDTSVLYKICNRIDNELILEVIKLEDPLHIRSDLSLGQKISIDLRRPVHHFQNEATAYKERKISAVNIPGKGCDLVGYVFLPEYFGGGYLVAGDYDGINSNIQKFEIQVCEIMCNLLSSIIMKSQYEHMSTYDNLTGLYNSRVIRDALHKACARLMRKDSGTLTVVLGDIDYFKKINDTYGHVQGDDVLSQIGFVLNQELREYIDMAGRYGGEEFLLIYEDVDAENILHLVDRLRKKIASFPFKLLDAKDFQRTGVRMQVTMSFGIAHMMNPVDKFSPQFLLSVSDKALYMSKDRGRNRVSMLVTDGIKEELIS